VLPKRIFQPVFTNNFYYLSIMNKYTFFGAIAVIGILGTAFGAWAKITHQAYADTAMTIGLTCRAIGLAALVWLLFMWLKKKD
jgi:hypothetical protein